jgi:hypothetical protein
MPENRIESTITPFVYQEYTGRANSAEWLEPSRRSRVACGQRVCKQKRHVQLHFPQSLNGLFHRGVNRIRGKQRQANLHHQTAFGTIGGANRAAMQQN